MKKGKRFLSIVAAGSLAGGLLFSAAACKGTTTIESPNPDEQRNEQQANGYQDELNALKQHIADMQQKIDELEGSVKDLDNKFNKLINSTMVELSNQIATVNELISTKADNEFIQQAMSTLNSLINELQEQLKSAPNADPEVEDKVGSLLTSALKVQTQQMALNSLQVKFSGKTYGNQISGYDKSFIVYYSPNDGGNYVFSSESLDTPIVTRDGLKFSKDIDGNERIETFNSETSLFSQTLQDIDEATTITKDGDVYTIANDQRILSRIESKDGIYINSIEEIEAANNGGTDIRTSHTFNYDDFDFKAVSTRIGSTMQNYVNYSKVVDAVDVVFNNRYFGVEDNLNSSSQQLGGLTAVFSNDIYAEKSNWNGNQNYYVLENEETKSLSVNENGEVQESDAPNVTKQDFILQVKNILKSGLEKVEFNRDENVYTFTLNQKNSLGEIDNVKTVKIKLNDNLIEIVASNANQNLSETCKLRVIMSEKEFLQEFNQIKEEVEQYKSEDVNTL